MISAAPLPPSAALASPASPGRGDPQSSTSSTSPRGSGLRAWRALAFFVGLIVLACAARAQTFPPFTGLVTDAANVLPADRKAALEARLEALQQQTNHQLVVATIPDLQGYDIADYGYRLGRAWAVGLKGANNGAILLVAPKERKVRVEVGYGLESVLTDGFSSDVIREQILPRFKAGDLPGGIAAGVDALDRQLRLPDDEAKAKAAAAAQGYDSTHRRAHRTGGGFPFGLVIWLAIMGLIFLPRLFGGRGRQHYAGGGGSNWPIWLWAGSEMLGGDRRDRAGGGGGIFGGDIGGGGGGGSDGGWGGGGFTGGGGGSFGGGGASGSW